VTALTSNQLLATGFAYDAAGNMTGDGAYTYGFNAESEIKSAAGVNYTYDGDGNRVQKSNGKIYWYGAATEILRVSGFVLANPELKKERDAETSNDDFGARYYSSRLGRWLSTSTPWSATTQKPTPTSMATSMETAAVAKVAAAAVPARPAHQQVNLDRNSNQKPILEAQARVRPRTKRPSHNKPL
jgi:hypothetical protein